MRAVSTVYAAGKKEAAPEPDMHTHTPEQEVPSGKKGWGSVGGLWCAEVCLGVHGWVCGYPGQYGGGGVCECGRRAAVEAEGNGWASPAASGVIKGQKSQTWR